MNSVLQWFCKKLFVDLCLARKFSMKIKRTLLNKRIYIDRVWSFIMRATKEKEYLNTLNRSIPILLFDKSNAEKST